jgi:3-oxoisoapionate decarboxylase
MDRRKFLLGSAAASAWALSPFAHIPEFLKGKRMGIVVHSYGIRWNSKAESKKYPGFQNATDLMTHCQEIGASGVQVMVKDWSPDFAKKVRDHREKLELYLEGSIGLPGKPEEISKFEQEVMAAKEAGAAVLRTVASSGRRYEVYHSSEEFQSAWAQALRSLQWAEPVVRKHQVKLAVENHKDWRAGELVDLLKKVNSEWVGVTLDFGNSIALIEDPMEVVQTLSPFAFSTHVKDMGLEEYPDGFLLSEVPLGKGVLDLQKMVALCEQHNPTISLNLEMITRDPLEIPCLKSAYWATFGETRGSELARALRRIRELKSKDSLPRVSQLSTEEKLMTEEENILLCLAYSETKLGLN